MKLHKVDIYYTKHDNRYTASHYLTVTNIYVSVWGNKLVIEYATYDRGVTKDEYDMEHIVAINIDDKLIELEDEE